MRSMFKMIMVLNGVFEGTSINEGTYFLPKWKKSVLRLNLPTQILWAIGYSKQLVSRGGFLQNGCSGPYQHCGLCVQGRVLLILE